MTAHMDLWGWVQAAMILVLYALIWYLMWIGGNRDKDQ
jgi:hypothetical protein